MRWGMGRMWPGIMAGNGSQSASVTSAPGSVLEPPNRQFRGKAPNAKLFVRESIFSAGRRFLMPIYRRAHRKPMRLLLTTVGVYVGLYYYSMSSASYDAATRDSQPGVKGSQPQLFVFAAGNDGGGDESGGEGLADTISAPATAKRHHGWGSGEFAQPDQ